MQIDCYVEKTDTSTSYMGWHDITLIIDGRKYGCEDATSRRYHCGNTYYCIDLSPSEVRKIRKIQYEVDAYPGSSLKFNGSGREYLNWRLKRAAISARMAARSYRPIYPHGEGDPNLSYEKRLDSRLRQYGYLLVEKNTRLDRIKRILDDRNTQSHLETLSLKFSHVAYARDYEGRMVTVDHGTPDRLSADGLFRAFQIPGREMMVYAPVRGTSLPEDNRWQLRRVKGRGMVYCKVA